MGVKTTHYYGIALLHYYFLSVAKETEVFNHFDGKKQWETYNRTWLQLQETLEISFHNDKKGEVWDIKVEISIVSFLIV